MTESRSWAARRAAVLGSPVSHSLSPVLHRAAYDALGLHDWSYGATECDADALADLLATSGPEVAGYSCTMPLKRVVLDVADLVTTKAAEIGAGNTLLPTEAGWLADNTDWTGIKNCLTERAVHADTAVILGAGGTAQAALAALADVGTVTVLVRDLTRTSDVRATAERLDRPVRVEAFSHTAVLRGADLVIATLPAGAADPLAAVSWRAEQVLLDAIYHPWPTALAAAFTASGATVISGAAMLLHQAGRQVELMTGRTAPIEAMRAALRRAAPGCGV